MLAATGTGVALGGDSPANAALEAANAQAELNNLLTAHASNGLFPIFEILHQAPTRRMAADLSRVLFDHALTLWITFLERLESEKAKEGALPADVLKRATGFAGHYGSPIIGSLTHGLDLRPPMMGPGGRPITAGFCQEVGDDGRPVKPPVPTWREEAISGLPMITEELHQRGFRRADPPGDRVVPGSHVVHCAFEADPAIIVRVWDSPYEAEPFVLVIERESGEDPRAIFNAHSTTHDQLLRTVDAFIAGLWQPIPKFTSLNRTPTNKPSLEALKELFKILSYPGLNLDVAYVDQARPESGFWATTKAPMHASGTDAPYDDGRRYRIRVVLGSTSPLLVDIMEPMPAGGGVILVPAKDCTLESAEILIRAFLAGFWTTRRG